jgi:hypothetical protein
LLLFCVTFFIVRIAIVFLSFSISCVFVASGFGAVPSYVACLSLLQNFKLYLLYHLCRLFRTLFDSNTFPFHSGARFLCSSSQEKTEASLDAFILLSFCYDGDFFDLYPFSCHLLFRWLTFSQTILRNQRTNVCVWMAFFSIFFSF